MKKVLITGANSYIGTSFEKYAYEHYAGELSVDTIDMIDGSWRSFSFAGYDIVYHVAGIAHADVGNVSEETRKKYYAVNTDLAIETAEKAKREGVRQFVFMSSAIVYGDSAPFGTLKRITKDTQPAPAKNAPANSAITGILAPQGMKVVSIADARLSLSSRMVRQAMIAGIPQPVPMMMGMMALPDRPTRLKMGSITAETLAI